MTRPADYVVVGLAVLSVPFLFGMGIGKDRALQQIATACIQQPGATLAATYQDKDGVTCAYIEAPRPGYGRAVRKQKATRT